MAQTSASRAGLIAVVKGISRTRLATGVLAIALSWVLASVPLQEASQLGQIVRAASYAGVAATVIGVVLAAPAWSVVAAGLLGAALVATWYGGEVTASVRVALFGVGLLLLAELIGWSAEAREETFPNATWKLRAVVLSLVIGGCLVASGVLLGVLSMPVPNDLALAATGAGAVVVVIGTLLSRARSAATAAAPASRRARATQSPPRISDP